MLRLLTVITFILGCQTVVAQSIQQKSEEVNQLTKAFAEDLQASDRRAIERRLEAVLDIYEDAGFSLNKSEFVCSGRSIYTKDGQFVLNTANNEQCLLNIDYNKRGSTIFCSGRTIYNTAGEFILNSSSNDQCALNLQFSAMGVNFHCSGRSLYKANGQFLMNSESDRQCRVNLEAISQGSDRVCSGRSLYNLEGQFVLNTSSVAECEKQILF